MKCTICGSDIPSGSDICVNCGTRVAEMGGNFGRNNSYGSGYSQTNTGYNNYGTNNTGYGTTNTGYGTGNTYNSGMGTYNSGYNAPSKGLTAGNTVLGGISKMGRFGWRLIGSLIVLVVFGIVSLVGNNFNKKYDMGSFTVKLPMNCKETTNEFSFDSSDDAKAYANSKLEFAYVAIDMTDVDLSDLDLNVEEFFTDWYAEELKDELTGYSERMHTTNRLKFSYYDSGNTDKTFVEMHVMEHGSKVYMMVCLCADKDSGKYESKFGKIFDSIDFK